MSEGLNAHLLVDLQSENLSVGTPFCFRGYVREMISWSTAANRIVDALGVRDGELIEVQDDSGRIEIVSEILMRIECRGATPMVHLSPPEYMATLLERAPLHYLKQWDLHRSTLLSSAHRRLLLGSTHPDLSAVSANRVQAWRDAVGRLSDRESELRLPFLLVGIPTRERAEQSGLAFDQLESLMLHALCVSVADLRTEIAAVVKHLHGSQHIVLETSGHKLRLLHGGRKWLTDDGDIDDADIAAGATGSNLPSGSIYTTVLEESGEGTLRLERAGPATDVLLHFREGRIVQIDAASGGDALRSIFRGHTGEPSRISHIGIGLNPALRHTIGWTLVDQHVHGNLFIAFGENRYMAGHNESSLNIDFCLPNARLIIDGKALAIRRGNSLLGPSHGLDERHTD